MEFAALVKVVSVVNKTVAIYQILVNKFDYALKLVLENTS
jgi:hypothetical protein